MTKAQQIINALAAFNAAGNKVNVSVDATASRNYGYYTVTLTVGDVSAKYEGSTVNSHHVKGSDFSERLAKAVWHEVTEKLAAGGIKANSNLGKAILEIAEELEVAA